jgi:hypothetical protein
MGKPLSIYGIKLGQTERQLLSIRGQPAHKSHRPDGLDELIFIEDKRRPALRTMVLLDASSHRVVYVYGLHLEQGGRKVELPSDPEEALMALPGGLVLWKAGNVGQHYTSMYWKSLHLRVDSLFTVDAPLNYYALGEDNVIHSVRPSWMQ